MGKYKVREAVEEDLPALTASGFAPGSGLDWHTGVPYDTLIAVDAAGAVLGRLQALYDDPRGPLDRLGVGRPQSWISFLNVVDDAQSRGVGGAMVAEFALRASRRGVAGIGLLVEFSGDRAGRVRFFNRCGFHEAWPGTPADIWVGKPAEIYGSCVAAAR